MKKLDSFVITKKNHYYDLNVGDHIYFTPDGAMVHIEGHGWLDKDEYNINKIKFEKDSKYTVVLDNTGTTTPWLTEKLESLLVS